ncbi:T9SS type B sorting domain-containing protein [Mucilaginibacter pallidiroseus]|uniref:T9SS type B sorting domain-containing protein n=1 Tax=Mucilaginibacter pallidiroseus TaxID=2599295 RepID=A0A563U3E1_9SPHI|nr:gliding motility-associated C-terminal domain-containing protein [Mucilaginibacter pallidiroseus]TWR25842.1 T9SS type B sorting domain-containing protein [Mucilaginibacter pallidiroseus]
MFALTVCAVLKSYSQSFYVATSYGSLNKVTITNNILTSVPVGGCSMGGFFSIAVRGNQLYYFGTTGSLYSADIVDGPSPYLTNCKFITADFSSNSLTVDKNGILYYASSLELYSYNPATNTKLFLGEMPYSPSGDLAFYKDELYMASYPGIVKVSLNYPESSSIDYPTYNAGYGLTTVKINGSSKLYTFTGNSTNYSLTDVYELDMENKTPPKLIGQLPYSVFDAGSADEVGNISVIQLGDIKIEQKCDAFNKARVTVQTPAHTANYTYELNGSQTNTTGIFDNLSPGNYQVVVRSDGNESPNGKTFVVPSFSVPGLNVTANIVSAACGTTGSIKLDAGTFNSSYKIQFEGKLYGFDHTFENLIAGDYQLTIIKPDGCIAYKKIYVVDQQPCPPIIINSVDVSPQCDAFKMSTVKINTAPSPEVYTYTLAGQTNTTGLFSNVEPGFYQLFVISASGQQVGRSVTVKDPVYGIPPYHVTKTDVLCNAKGSIKFSLSGASNGYKIKYDGTTYDLGQEFTALSTGTYHFTILTAEGCIADELDYVIAEASCPFIAIEKIETAAECDVFKTASVKVYTAVHPDVYFYTLNNVTNQTGEFRYISPGVYKLVITSSGGDRKEQDVTVPDFTITKPAINVTIKHPVCDLPGEVQLEFPGTSNTYIIRFNGQAFDQSRAFTNLKAGTHHFTILNAAGCIVDERDFILIQQTCPPITVTQIKTDAECDAFGLASVTVLTASHPDTYTYKLAGATNTSGVFNNLLPGNYMLTITSSGGDYKEQTVTVPDFKVLNKPGLTVQIQNPVCTLAGNVTFVESGNLRGATQIAHNGNFYNVGQKIGNLGVGNNQFKVLNATGCVLDEINIVLKQEDCIDVSFPNTFTPNGDGVNDIFRPNQDSNPVNYRLTIFDRNGQQLFTTTDLRRGWDGTNGNVQYGAGVYYWMVKYIMPDGSPALGKGWVTLVR